MEGIRLKNKNHVKSRYIAQAVVWLILLIVAIVALPNINQLVRKKGQITVPKSATSQVADVIQNHWGRNEDNTRQFVVVFNNGEQPLTTKRQGLSKISNDLNQARQNYKTPTLQPELRTLMNFIIEVKNSKMVRNGW